MFLNIVVKLATTAAMVTGGYMFLDKTAPDAAAKINAAAHDYFLGWNDASCQQNPLGCLSSRYRTLQILEKKFDGSAATVREQKDRIEALIEEQQLTVAKNSAFLNEGKNLLKDSIVQSQPTIDFAGKTYPDSSTFKHQLSLLYKEKKGLQRNLENSIKLQKQLQEQLDSVMVQSGDITLAKRMIPAQIELVRANMTLSDFSENLQTINGVIKGSETGLTETDNLIRTTKDLMELSTQVDNSAATTSKEFEQFLAN